jgi:hypothetical protein
MIVGDIQKNKAARLQYINNMRDKFGFEDKEIVGELRAELSVLDAKNASIISAVSIMFVGFTIVIDNPSQELKDTGLIPVIIVGMLGALLLLGQQILRIARVRWSRYELGLGADEYFEELLIARNQRTRALRRTSIYINFLGLLLVVLLVAAYIDSIEFEGVSGALADFSKQVIGFFGG